MPLPAEAHGGGLAVRALLDGDGDGLGQRLHAFAPRRVDGDLHGAHLRRGVPRGDVDDAVEALSAVVARLDLPLGLQEPLAAVPLDVVEEPGLHAGLAGDVGEGEGHLLDGGLRQAGLELPPHEEGGLLPVAHGLLEVDRALPGGVRSRAQASSARPA